MQWDLVRARRGDVLQHTAYAIRCPDGSTTNIRLRQDGIGIPVWVGYSGSCHPFTTLNAFGPRDSRNAIYDAEIDLNEPHPNGSLGDTGTYRLRVRFWGIVEAKMLGLPYGARPDGSVILDFGRMYLSPALEDYTSLPDGIPVGVDSCGNQYTKPWPGSVYGSYSDDPANMKLYPRNEWRHIDGRCGWNFEDYYWTASEGDNINDHGHPIWVNYIRSPAEQAFRSGNLMSHGGCARPQSFVGIFPMKLNPTYADLNEDVLSTAATSIFWQDQGVNIYAAAIYNSDNGQCEELWTLNTAWYPVSGGHPNLDVPNSSDISLTAISQFNRGSLRLHILDYTHEFIVPGGRRKLVLRINTEDFGVGVVLPAYLSQVFAHASRWQKLRMNPQWRNHPFVKYMNDMNFPHDWLWPYATNPPNTSNYKNTNWYFDFVQRICRDTARYVEQLFPRDEWPPCSFEVGVPDASPVDFVPYMQSIVVVDRSITRID